MRAMNLHPIAAMGRSYRKIWPLPQNDWAAPTVELPTLWERAVRAICGAQAPGKSSTALARIPRWISLLPP